MKKLFLSLAIGIMFVAIPVLLFCQNQYTDVVYLKNGTVIRGVIIEQVPNVSLKIQSADKSISEFQIDQVEKITKEEVTGSPVRSASTNKGFFLGFRAGANFATWSNTSVDSPAKEVAKVGLQAGVMGLAGISESFGIQMELYYSQKGYKLTATDNNITVKAWTTVNYLEFPVLARLTYSNKAFILYGNFGPAVGIGLNAKLATDPDMGFNSDIKFEEGGLNQFDFGLVIGAGAGGKIGSGQLFVDLRYEFGLTDINNVSSDVKNEPDYESNANRNFGVSVGYLINLGK